MPSSITDRLLDPTYGTVTNVFDPMGFLKNSNITDFTHPFILWGIDGNFEFNIVPPNKPFASTDHCGAIQILDPSIVPDFLLYALHLRRVEESFDRAFRASLTNMRKFVLKIPIKADGSFDVEAQKQFAARFTAAQKKKAALEEIKKRLDGLFDNYIGNAPVGQ